MIVERYQGVVCGIAYSTCGDLGRSEELAQDTFVTAWKSLQKIKEPAKLRFWLIGIVRNLANNAVRKGHRIPTEGAEPLSMEVASPMDTPAAQAIGNEEAVLMWRALEVMPPLYREPMILFYREGQSIQALATSLDLTEELVRKRLSRGRAMLEAHVSKSIETALWRSRPSRNFVVGVLAALSGLADQANGATSAVTMYGIATKATATAGGIGSLATLPFLGIATIWAEYRQCLGWIPSPDDRTEARWMYRRLLLWVFGCAVVFGGLLLWARNVNLEDRTLLAWAILGFLAVQALGIVSLIGAARYARRKRQREENFSHASSPDLSKPRWEYCSSLRLLGLPLLHIRLGKPGWSSKVTAWIAVGNCAIGGVFALGEVAVAPLSIGGVAIGILPLGGCGIGVFALGGLAVGWQAFGGLALAWNAALGVVAVAHDFALGGISSAGALNDARASLAIETGPFFTGVKWGVRHLVWLNVLWLLPLVTKASKGGPRAVALVLNIFALLAFSSAGYSQETAPAVPKKMFMWKATSSKSGVAYLVGSMHLATPDFYPLPTAMEEAFSKADALVVETDITRTDKEAMRVTLKETGTYPTGDALAKHLSPETYRALSAFCATRGLPIAGFDRLKPWVVLMTVRVLMVQGAGLSPESGIDLHFLTAASQSHKPVRELESTEGQLKMLADFTDPELELQLAQTLAESSRIKTVAQQMKEAWLAGNEQEVERIALTFETGDNPALRGVMKKVVDDRNGPMAEKIIAEMESGHVSFVVVGAAHLVGEQGIVRLLRKKGCSVVQMQQ